MYLYLNKIVLGLSRYLKVFEVSLLFPNSVRSAGKYECNASHYLLFFRNNKCTRINYIADHSEEN